MEKYGERRTIKRGEKISKKGDSVDCVTFIMAGFATSETGDFMTGDFFGEDGLLSSLEASDIKEGTIENDISAKSDLEVLSWKYKHALDSIKQFGDDFKAKLIRSLKEYTTTFSSKVWHAILKNAKLCKLLKMQMKEHDFVKMLQGPIQFKKGDKILAASKEKDTEHKTLILEEGSILVIMDDSILTMRNSMTFRGSSQKNFVPGYYFPGTFIGDINSILKGGSACLDATAETDGVYYQIDMKEMRRFLEENPGFQLQMLDSACFGEVDPLDDPDNPTSHTL